MTSRSHSSSNSLILKTRIAVDLLWHGRCEYSLSVALLGCIHALNGASRHGFLTRPPQNAPRLIASPIQQMKHLLLAILILVPLASVRAQAIAEACIINRNTPPVSAYYWPPDSEVKVYLMRNMFTAGQRETLFAAMKTWSVTAAQTGAGIKFSYAGETSTRVSCPGCLTVTRREVHKSDSKHYAFFNPLEQDEDGLLVSAWIDFDFATISPQALQGFMAHELGHGMGLWDCPTCKKKQTIMNGFPGVNSDNGLLAPSACDLEQVRQVYQLQRRLSSNVVVAEQLNRE